MQHGRHVATGLPGGRVPEFNTDAATERSLSHCMDCFGIFIQDFYKNEHPAAPSSPPPSGLSTNKCANSSNKHPITCSDTTAHWAEIHFRNRKRTAKTVFEVPPWGASPHFKECGRTDGSLGALVGFFWGQLGATFCVFKCIVWGADGFLGHR